MQDDRRISFCPHCSNECTHQKTFEYNTATKEWDELRENLLGESQCTYFLAICETCNHPLLYYIDENTGVCDSTASDFQNAELVWPQGFELDYIVPDTITHCYRTAARLRDSDPNAYAMQIRRALEALCDERGTVKSGLQRRLQDLAFKNEIPPLLAEMSEMLRVLGNVGAHDHQHYLSVSDTRVIDDFFRTVVEYVYVAPSRIRCFRAELAKFGRHPAAADKEPPIANPLEKTKHSVN